MDFVVVGKVATKSCTFQRAEPNKDLLMIYCGIKMPAKKTEGGRGDH